MAHISAVAVAVELQQSDRLLGWHDRLGVWVYEPDVTVEAAVARLCEVGPGAVHRVDLDDAEHAHRLLLCVRRDADWVVLVAHGDALAGWGQTDDPTYVVSRMRVLLALAKDAQETVSLLEFDPPLPDDLPPDPIAVGLARVWWAWERSLGMDAATARFLVGLMGSRGLVEAARVAGVFGV